MLNKILISHTKIFNFILNDKSISNKIYIIKLKSLAVLNEYIFVPFKHIPVPIKITSCFIKKNVY